MSELIAILALLAATGNIIVTWQVLEQGKATAIAINARAAESLAKENETAAAIRELACVQLLPEPERRQCKAIARMQ